MNLVSAYLILHQVPTIVRYINSGMVASHVNVDLKG